MLVSEFVTRVNYALRGTDDDAPSSGSDEWNYWVSLLNRKKDELYQDLGKKWRAAFKETQPDEPGTVETAGTTALTGTGTYFTDYKAGDKILVSGETVRTIDAITSDTALTVTVAFDNTDSGLSFSRQTIIATGVEEYNLHRSFLGASDYAQVVTSDGITYQYNIAEPAARNATSRRVFISGVLPQTITFTSDIESTEDIVGGILTVPGYYLPDDVTADTDVVPLPDANWGVLAVAAEVAFNDITYEDKTADLTTKANYLFTLMSRNNRRGTYGEPKTTPYNLKRLGMTER